MRYERAFKEAWTESVPAPLAMTDTEIVDWLSEYCDWARFMDGEWHVSSEDCPAISELYLRDAVRLAAAYHKEANE